MRHIQMVLDSTGSSHAMAISVPNDDVPLRPFVSETNPTRYTCERILNQFS